MYLRSFKGRQILSGVSVSTVVVLGLFLTSCSLGLCYTAVVAVLSIVLQYSTLPNITWKEWPWCEVSFVYHQNVHVGEML